MSLPSDTSENSTERVGNYILKNKLGQGSFATVFKAQHQFTKEIVAVKCVRRSKLSKKMLENLESEISILTGLRHDHIVGLTECQKTEQKIYLVMEYCSLGDLSVYIKEIRSNKETKGAAGGLPERVVRHFLKQFANAIQFLRSKNLVHRDIKPQNLLLISPSQEHDLPILKVADFGFARFLPNASLADTLCGSPLYMAPEILSYKKYDAKADLWSVGAVLYEMITGRPPFRANNHIELLKKIQENNDQIHFPDERHQDIVIGSDLKDLVRKLLKKNPIERLSFEEFFTHPAVIQQSSIAAAITTATATALGTTALGTTIQKRRTSSTGIMNKYNRHSMTSATNYELPPFAQITPRNYSDTDHHRQSISGRPTKFESKDHRPWTPSSPSEPNQRVNSGTQPSHKRTGEEDMLQEYVVLDRRIIETNQFADELDASPRSIDNLKKLAKSPSSISNAVNIPTTPNTTFRYSNNQQEISPSTPPFVRERKTSSGSSSAGSALAKAISKASVRLFGTSIPSPPKEHHHLVGSPHGFMSSYNHEVTSNRTMKRIERFACMAHAVSRYGDQKYELYKQMAPVNENGNGSGTDSTTTTVDLAEEPVVLYVKALALLEMGLYVAQQYWQQQILEDEENDEKKKKSLTTCLNEAVQWMRDKFNECLDKAESIKHNNMDHSTSCVEKLLYDRALEMSRAAAVHELVGENVTECEQDYQTAIWMLEAILQVRPNDEVTVEEDDRRIINKFIDSIRHRITVLRKKIEVSERV